MIWNSQVLFRTTVTNEAHNNSKRIILIRGNSGSGETINGRGKITLDSMFNLYSLLYKLLYLVSHLHVMRAIIVIFLVTARVNWFG